MSDRISLAITVAALVAALLVGHPALALLIAIAISLTLQPDLPAIFKPASKYLLQGAIVLLGFTLNTAYLWQVSQDYAGLIVIYVLASLGLGMAFGAMIATDRDQTTLLSAGTAICGGTTIATLAPVIRATPQSMAICLSIVFMLNAIAILTMPTLGRWLEMSQEQFGVWAALAIHDTSSVVGAAALYGDEALEVATTVKLARTLWLIPLVIVAGLLVQRGSGKVRVPGFILLFVAASVLGSFIGLDAFVGNIKSTSQLLLVAALFLIGLEINRSTIKELNAKALWLGVGLWLVVVPTTYFAVMAW